MNHTTLEQLRHEIYDCFEQGADALFNLADALLCESQAQSLPELSLSRTSALSASVTARILRLVTAGNPDVHTFEIGHPDATLTVQHAGQASGLGDVVLRTKYHFLRMAGGGLAAALLFLELFVPGSTSLRQVLPLLAAPILFLAWNVLAGLYTRLRIAAFWPRGRRGTTSFSCGMSKPENSI